jgi:hypothetical protein
MEGRPMTRRALFVWLAVASASLCLACDDKDTKKVSTTCSADSQCAGGGCYESSCYAVCQGQDECATDEICEPSMTVDAARMSLCVPASAVVQCDTESPAVLDCPVGTWSASATRQVDVEAECVHDGLVTYEAIISFTRAADGTLNGTFTSTNNPNPEDGTCATYTKEGVALQWNDDDQSIEIVMSSRSECEGVEVDWATTYGLKVGADRCCQALTGQSWIEPIDACDENSGRSTEPVSFERVTSVPTDTQD